MQSELQQQAKAKAAYKELVMQRIEHSTAQSVDEYAKQKIGPVDLENNEGWFMYKRSKSEGKHGCAAAVRLCCFYAVLLGA